MSRSARRSGLLLALAAGLVLLWLWLRSADSRSAAASQHPAPQSDQSGANARVPVAAADPGLLRTAAPGVAIPAAAPPAADLQESVQIEGRLVFEGGTDYPLPFSRVQVITDAPVIGEEVPRLGPDEFGTQVVYLLPVGDNGQFSFRIPATQAAAAVSAAGPSCIATRDVLAITGTPVEIPMAFFYCGAVSLRDADSGALLDEVTNLALEGGGTAFHPETGASTAVRSTLALLRVRRQVPETDNRSTLRQFFTTPRYYEAGLPLKVFAQLPGFEPLEADVVIPGYSGELPVQIVSLQSTVKVRSEVALMIQRPGDWSGTESCEYSGTGQITIHSDQPGADQLISHSPLRPGLLTLRGIPFSGPRLWYEAEYAGRTRDSPKPFEILLAAPPSPGGPFTGELAISDRAAFYVPSRTDTVGEYAFFGHIRHSDGKPGWRRYMVRKGLILDGLRPDRYRVFWGSTREEIRQRMDGNLPFADLTLVPGLNRLPPPQ